MFTLKMATARKVTQILLARCNVLRELQSRIHNASSNGVSRSFVEFNIPVPWGHIAVKWWGAQDKQPILCVHGWQDNMNTYDTLLPLLNENLSFVTFDYPGHGLSSQLPNGMWYHLIDVAVMLRRVHRFFGWPQLSILAHSLGANMSFIYGCLYPDQVDLLIELDGMKPYSYEPGAHIDRTAKNIDRFLHYDDINNAGTEPPSYPYEDLRMKLHAGSYNSIDLDKTHHIFHRMIEQSVTDPKKYYFTRDCRLKVGNSIGFQHADLREFAKRIKCPLLVIRTIGNKFIESEQYLLDIVHLLQSSHKDFKYVEVPVKHHGHLNEPEKMAGIINDFIAKYRKSAADIVPIFASRQVAKL